ncbi:MAG: M1 family metallopeptidase, partial [Saprospiraceae bacterium]
MRLLLTLLLLLVSNLLAAQKPYFHQEVNYKIAATLIDSIHTITGNIEIEYVNKSPDQLEFIYFHLWGNAFQNRTTAFAEQKLREGSTEFYFASTGDLGGYTDLNFTVNGQSAVLELQKDNPDIAVLRLPKPLESGQKVTIQTPFTLRIPASFSRLGHVGESYQMTQWYPKPAVYDADGWHPMPNLDMGEYYSEFGNYDVTITLPANYVVAATGVLQTDSEQNFLQQQVENTNAYLAKLSFIPSSSTQEAFPPSSAELKTIRYTAENVHDFAWFADKRFKVQKSEVPLNSGKTVDTWVFFTEFEQQLWKDAIQYVDRSVKFYSDLVGEYPYPQATAVQSALSAGAGMEYPMITVIGTAYNAQALDVVITHEVGHNWFYGILANNERDHAWMDEGINSYYEKRYTKTYYDNKGVIISLPDIIQKGSNLTFDELAYLWQARRHRDQAPATSSNE